MTQSPAPTDAAVLPSRPLRRWFALGWWLGWVLMASIVFAVAFHASATTGWAICAFAGIPVLLLGAARGLRAVSRHLSWPF